MTGTTPEPSFSNLPQHTTPAGGRLSLYASFSVQQFHIHGGSSVEWSVQPGTLRPEAETLSSVRHSRKMLYSVIVVNVLANNKQIIYQRSS
ncbi:hypothetical protein AVEN_204531-1 [Araneus ventricosus]|uniref:Uncharacterized protein n=1 Tax=Araneus ventricosus TaxID=182803 RepID=A0A4Y2HQH7_ARAVE|nr:hypothetical protein AVEN_204531-1 [Araneus ventricosus]